MRSFHCSPVAHVSLKDSGYTLQENLRLQSLLPLGFVKAIYENARANGLLDGTLFLRTLPLMET